MNIARTLQSTRGSAPLLALLALSACSAASSSDGISSSPLTLAGDSEAADECTATKSEDGWCWGGTNHPMGAIGNFFVVGEDDVWASTSTAVLAHWNGQRWNPVKIGDELHHVWGFSGSNLWAVGAVRHQGQNSTGVIYHYDGTTWTKVFDAPEQVDRIWGVAPNDVWAAGWHNGLWHWDGTSWTQVGTITPLTGGPAFKIDGTTSTDVWRVAWGESQTDRVTHWDGTEWKKMDPPADLNFVGMETVRALAKTDVWFGGTRRLLRYNGSTWSRVVVPGLPENGEWSVSFITGTARDLYFGVRSTDINGGSGTLFHWNGVKVEPVALPESLERSPAAASQAIERTSRGTLWLARSAGDIYRRMGGAFARTSSGSQIDFTTAASHGNDVAASGYSGSVAFLENGAWRSRIADPDHALMTGLAMPQPGITLAASTTSFVRFEGSGDPLRTQPFGTSPATVPSLAAARADDVWVARDGGLWHLLGSTWSKVSGPGSFVSKVYVPARGEVYVTTSRGAYRFDGAFWQQVWSQPTKEIVKAADGSLWGLVSGQTGKRTAILHDGQLVPTGDEDMDFDSHYLQSLTVCPDGRIFGVGTWNPEAMSYDHGTWKREATSTSRGLKAITCTADGTVWGFGEGGIIVKKPLP